MASIFFLLFAFCECAAPLPTSLDDPAVNPIGQLISQATVGDQPPSSINLPVMGHASFALPLASPIGNPSHTYIAPWTFGKKEWDPVVGSSKSFGPHPEYSSSKVSVEQLKEHSPPGIPMETNPQMYIVNPPTGLPTSQTLVSPTEGVFIEVLQCVNCRFL